MKSVLISIQPKWVEKIVKGEKTIEVRKSRPKLETPFKCYIYCTKDKKDMFWVDKQIENTDGLPKGLKAYNSYLGNRSVIGEFVCEKIVQNFKYLVTPKGLESACLTKQEVSDYLGLKGGYGWHITDLKIYDKPKALREFRTCRKCCGKEYDYCGNCIGVSITRPPQSWCYVESLEG